MEFNKNNFDLIRLLAALQVVVLHGVEHFQIGANELFVDTLALFPGVPIFFLVSGFLISSSLERSSSISRYVQNRFLRVYPALWVSFIVSLVTVFLFFDPKFTLFGFAAWVAAQISVGQFYNPGFLRGYGIGTLNGSLWTIPVELQFYVALPLVYHCMRKITWSPNVIIVAMLILMSINHVYYVFYSGMDDLNVKLFGVTLIPHMYIFMIGVLMQRNFRAISNFVAGRFLLFLVLYLLSVPIVLRLGWSCHGNTINPLSVVLLSLVVLSFAYSYVDTLGDLLRGYDISYGIYVYHCVLINAILEVSSRSPGLNMFIMLLLTTVMAFGSWVLIDCTLGERLPPRD